MPHFCRDSHYSLIFIMDFPFLGLHSALYFWRINCHYHSWSMYYTGLLLLIYSSNMTCATPSLSLSLTLYPFLAGKPKSTELGGWFQKLPSKFKVRQVLLTVNEQCWYEKGLKQWRSTSQASPFGGSNILAGSHGFPHCFFHRLSPAEKLKHFHHHHDDPEL